MRPNDEGQRRRQGDESIQQRRTAIAGGHGPTHQRPLAEPAGKASECIGLLCCCSVDNWYWITLSWQASCSACREIEWLPESDRLPSPRNTLSRIGHTPQLEQRPAADDNPCDPHETALTPASFRLDSACKSFRLPLAIVGFPFVFRRDVRGDYREIVRFRRADYMNRAATVALAE